MLDRVGTPGLLSSVPHSHRECRNTRNFGSAVVGPANRCQHSQRFSFRVFNLFLGRTGGPKPWILGMASGVGPGLARSEHGPCFVRGTVTLDDVSFTTNIAIHSGGDAIAPYRCVTLVDTGSLPIPSSEAMFWIVCFWWQSLRRCASGPAALVHGVVLANLSLCGSRPPSASVSNFAVTMNRQVPSQCGSEY